MQQPLFEQDAARSAESVRRGLRELLGITSELTRSRRHRQAMPQRCVGHLDRMRISIPASFHVAPP